MEIGKLLNPSNVRDFIQGNYMMWKDQLTSTGIAKHYKEQALYRALLCRPCLINGKCLICNCKTPNMFFSINKVDSDNKWGAMVEVEEWEAFKKENGVGEIPTTFEDIKIDETYGGHNGQL